MKYKEYTLNDLIDEALPDLREIVFHSDGRVTAKTGAKAFFPKKLYTKKAPKDGLFSHAEVAKKAVAKLLRDRNTLAC